MKQIIFFLLFSVGLYGQGIEPTSFQPTPFKGGILAGVIQTIDEFTGDTLYMYQHSDTSFASIDSLVYTDSLRLYTNKGIFSTYIDVGSTDSIYVISGSTKDTIKLRDGSGFALVDRSTGGTVTSVTGTSPIIITGTPASTPNVTIQNATTTQTGALTSTDWNAFNGKVGGSGSANKVAYWTGANTQSFNNNFHFDNTNIRLGLGTASPTYKFTLNFTPPSGDFDGIRLNVNSQVGVVGYAGSSMSYMGIPGNAFSIYNNGNMSLISDGGAFALHQNGSKRVELNTNLGTSPTTRIGAGTFNPSYMLDVSDSRFGQYAARIYNSGIGDRQGLLIQLDESAVGRLALKVTTAGAPNAFAVNADGTVGIGIAATVNSTFHLYNAQARARLESFGTNARSEFNFVNPSRNLGFGISPDGNSTNWFGIYDATNNKFPYYLNSTGNAAVINWQFGAATLEELNINGGLLVQDLSGAGTRMVTANSSGVLSAQTIPSSIDQYLNPYIQGGDTTGFFLTVAQDTVVFISGADSGEATTVGDTPTIDLTLTGVNITADVKDASITPAKLDRAYASVSLKATTTTFATSSTTQTEWTGGNFRDTIDATGYYKVELYGTFISSDFATGGSFSLYNSSVTDAIGILEVSNSINTGTTTYSRKSVQNMTSEFINGNGVLTTTDKHVLYGQLTAQFTSGDIIIPKFASEIAASTVTYQAGTRLIITKLF